MTILLAIAAINAGRACADFQEREIMMRIFTPGATLGVALILTGVLSACGSSQHVVVNAGSSDVSVAAPLPIVSQNIQPSETGNGISFEARPSAYHHVSEPQYAADRKNVLIVFLGGSDSDPGDYSDITDYAASLGYGVVDLRYVNSQIVGVVCADNDACFAQMRGEAVFGAGIAYAPNQPSYDSSNIAVDAANSMVNRLLDVLDFLASQTPSLANPDPSYWLQFLQPDSSSPYTSKHNGAAYPTWSKIVISGHSQGGGDASFLAMNLPVDMVARRVVMFSAPNDNVGHSASASWIGRHSATPTHCFWGLRNANESDEGSFVSINWANLGGLEDGGVGGVSHGVEVNIGDGSGDPQHSQRLVTSSPNLPGDFFYNHDSTAVNGAYLPAIKAAWSYLFTAAGSD